LIQPQFSPFFDSFDLVNLPNWTACVKTTVGGQVTTPFTLHASPPNVALSAATADQIRGCSRMKYGRPRTDAEKAIKQSLSGQVEDSTACGQRVGFIVVLTSVGPNKINVIKVVREITGLGLREAKDVVDSVPRPIKEGASQDEADAIREKLIDAGATVDVR